MSDGEQVQNDLDQVDKDPQAVGGEGAPPPPTSGDEPSAPPSEPTTEPPVDMEHPDDDVDRGNFTEFHKDT